MATSEPCDEDADIDWHGFLDEKYHEVPLHALRYSATRRLGQFLSQRQVMHDDIIPDFGGLAELVGFDGVEIKSFEREVANPGKAVLDEWMNRPELDPTLGHLVRLLAQLGREDILTDCHDLIAKEAKVFLEKPKTFLNNRLPVQEPTVSQGPGTDEVPCFLTRDEVIERRQIVYDAFVCYNAYGESEKDFEFVKELIRRFENPPYNFKLFVPHRDNLAGLAEHDINATIISQRCRHMIVILSNNFMESQACAFQTAFAHSLSPGAKNKRLIPVLVEEVSEMPNILRFMSSCDFTKKILYDWSWERLAKSISVTLNSEDYQVSSPAKLDHFLPQGSSDLSSNFLPADMLTSSTSQADSGVGNSFGAPQSTGDVFSSSSQPVTASNRASSSASEDTEMADSSASGHGQSAPGGLVLQQQTYSKRSSKGDSNAPPSSPSLGSRALKKIKQTFSSTEKRKSGPQPST